MFGTETASISSPTGLIGVQCNRSFFIDYYQDSNQVAAALGTKQQAKFITMQLFAIV
jgi:hypothetical protein